MTHDDPEFDGSRIPVRRTCPIWVRIALWGVSTRTVAMLLVWLSLLLAGVSVVLSLRDRRALIGIALFPVSMWYWSAIHWLDRNGGWCSSASRPVQSKVAKAIGWIGVALLLTVLVVKFVFVDYYRIPQNGMYPGLPANSVVFVLKRAYSDASSVQRGDVIVFTREKKGHRYNYIWRVIALPGDKVEASGESLTINGQLTKRSRLRDADGKTVFQEQIADASYEVAFSRSPASLPPDVSIVVPADHFFVLGDNRFDSRDSRYFGPIPFSSIIGKKL